LYGCSGRTFRHRARAAEDCDDQCPHGGLQAGKSYSSTRSHRTAVSTISRIAWKRPWSAKKRDWRTRKYKFAGARILVAERAEEQER